MGGLIAFDFKEVQQHQTFNHRYTDMSPNNAKQGNNNIEIWLSIYNKANFNRKYPPLKKGDKVRTYIKPTTFKKGYESSWSKDVFEIIAISEDGKQYMVNNNTKKLYSRHELLKIRGAEGKDD